MASSHGGERTQADEVEEERALRTVMIHLRAKDVPLRPAKNWNAVGNSVQALNQMATSDYVNLCAEAFNFYQRIGCKIKPEEILCPSAKINNKDKPKVQAALTTLKESAAQAENPAPGFLQALQNFDTKTHEAAVPLPLYFHQNAGSFAGLIHVMAGAKTEVEIAMDQTTADAAKLKKYLGELTVKELESLGVVNPEEVASSKAVEAPKQGVKDTSGQGQRLGKRSDYPEESGSKPKEQKIGHDVGFVERLAAGQVTMDDLQGMMTQFMLGALKPVDQPQTGSAPQAAPAAPFDDVEGIEEEEPSTEEAMAKLKGVVASKSAAKDIMVIDSDDEDLGRGRPSSKKPGQGVRQSMGLLGIFSSGSSLGDIFGYSPMTTKSGEPSSSSRGRTGTAGRGQPLRIPVKKDLVKKPPASTGRGAVARGIPLLSRRVGHPSLPQLRAQVDRPDRRPPRLGVLSRPSTRPGLRTSFCLRRRPACRWAITESIVSLRKSKDACQPWSRRWLHVWKDWSLKTECCSNYMHLRMHWKARTKPRCWSCRTASCPCCMMETWIHWAQPQWSRCSVLQHRSAQCSCCSSWSFGAWEGLGEGACAAIVDPTPRWCQVGYECWHTHAHEKKWKGHEKQRKKNEKQWKENERKLQEMKRNKRNWKEMETWKENQ